MNVIEAFYLSSPARKRVLPAAYAVETPLLVKKLRVFREPAFAESPALVEKLVFCRETSF